MTHLCECGCGQPAPIAKRTNRRQGAVKGEPQRFVLGHTLRGSKRGAANVAWRGGRYVAKNGYIFVYSPGHPRAVNGSYVLEHLLVVERALGRVVPMTAEVHHVDENPANNAPGNLVVCENRRYHQLLHKRARALAACGDANAHRCYFCRGYDRQDDIRVTSQGKTRHRSCELAYARARVAR